MADSSSLSHRSAGQPWELQEFADYLRVSKKTLERAIKLKKLKVIRIQRRILIPDVEAQRVSSFGFDPVAATK